MVAGKLSVAAAAATIEEGFAEYRRACYGDAPLSPVQLKEVRQAFLSGILWRSRDGLELSPDAVVAALRELLRDSMERRG